MEAIAMGRGEFKKLVKEAFIDVLTERRDLTEDAVIEAIEDIGLGIAMEEGRTGEYVEKATFFRKLENKAKGAK
jgi:hypothetical protein